MEIQTVFDKYKTVTYMCQYFSKTESQCSKDIKQAPNEVFENNKHHHDTMKAIAKAYLSNQERSVQKAVYHILSELQLRRIFPAEYFVNTNLLEKRVQVLFSKKELSKLSGKSPYIFKRSNIDCYIENPSGTFCNWKYIVLKYFFYFF